MAAIQDGSVDPARRGRLPIARRRCADIRQGKIVTDAHSSPRSAAEALMTTRLEFSKLTLMDALDLATLIEVEAFNRYTQFADQLGSHSGDDASAVFQSMAANENKHAEQIAERRLALFGDERPKVKLSDIFDVEAPEVGAPHWHMSPLKAYRVALASEKKAFAFYDEALRNANLPEVKALFEELRQEEAEHVRMIEEIIAKLPSSAGVDDEDEDEYPNSTVRKLAKDRFE
jgi:erythrin-vacuolar iron transport family protein